jgi:hypothetical protein
MLRSWTVVGFLRTAPVLRASGAGLLLVIWWLASGCDGGTGGGAAPPECDPAAQTCAGGTTCDLICVGTVSSIGCRAGGSIDVGQTCPNPASCKPGTGCFATASTPTSTCIKFCGGDGDCQTGTTCQERQVTRGCGAPPPVFKVKFCLP